MTTLTIHERDATGQPTATYVISSTTTAASKTISVTTSRVDVISPQSSTTQATNPSALGTRLRVFVNQLLTPFLPTGYPHSVSPDYTPYQIYDSLQAFASTIAGLLASRAVLVGLGVGSDTASATAAMLLSIAQESIGRFATIFFAHHFALRIEGEVKFYRFFADIVNDIAFVLDVLSPMLPTFAKVPALCCSSTCRAICGVCGGSSKAILSAHFASQGNIGELNAKDGSQETVISLIGLWVGGWVVSQVHGTKATWTCLIVLLGIHLWANFMAVKSVRLKTLNRGRAGMVLRKLLDQKNDIGIDTIGAEERLFFESGSFRTGKRAYGCTFGDMKELLKCLGGTTNPKTKSYTDIPIWLERLFVTFAREDYLLWINTSSMQCTIVLKDGAPETQLKAWCHGIRVIRLWEASDQDQSDENVLSIVDHALHHNQKQWAKLFSNILEAGWNVASSNLETTAGKRISASM